MLEKSKNVHHWIDLRCHDMTWVHDGRRCEGSLVCGLNPKDIAEQMEPCLCWDKMLLVLSFWMRMRTAPLDFILNFVHLLPCLGLEGYWMLHMLLASGCSAYDLLVSWMQLWTSPFGFWMKFRHSWIKCMFLMLQFLLHRLQSSLLKWFFTNITSKYKWQMMYKFNNEKKHCIGQDLLARVGLLLGNRKKTAQRRSCWMVPLLQLYHCIRLSMTLTLKSSTWLYQVANTVTSCQTSSNWPVTFHSGLLGVLITSCKYNHQITVTYILVVKHQKKLKEFARLNELLWLILWEVQFNTLHLKWFKYYLLSWVQ